MAKYIELETFLRNVKHNAPYIYAMVAPIAIITPKADVVEVRHGKWLDNGERNRDGTLKPFTISCSVCGSSAGFSWMKYCPNCGAKMDGGKADG